MNELEDSDVTQLPLFKSLGTCSPISKVLILPEIKGRLELLIAYRQIWSPALITHDGHVFRKDAFRKETYDLFKRTLSTEQLEKAINCLSIHKLFKEWPEEDQELALKCAFEIAEWLAEDWRNCLKQSHPDREFCVVIEEGEDKKADVPSVNVTFYESREPERKGFSQLVKQIIGTTLPPYYMHRLNTLFHRRYFNKLPTEKDNIIAKPLQGKPGLYLVQPGETIIKDAIAALLDSLIVELEREEKNSDIEELAEDQEVVKLLQNTC